MKPFRRRLRLAVAAWLLFQVVSLSALVPRDCCDAHHAAAAEAERCHERADSPYCPMRSQGRSCPMHPPGPGRTAGGQPRPSRRRSRSGRRRARPRRPRVARAGGTRIAVQRPLHGRRHVQRTGERTRGDPFEPRRRARRHPVARKRRPRARSSAPRRTPDQPSGRARQSTSPRVATARFIARHACASRRVVFVRFGGVS